MAGAKETWTDYAVGAGLGLVIYHYVLRKRYPNTFPALNLNSIEQIPGIDLSALSVCRQKGLM